MWKYTRHGDVTQQAHDVRMRSRKRRCDVNTSSSACFPKVSGFAAGVSVIIATQHRYAHIHVQYPSI